MAFEKLLCRVSPYARHNCPSSPSVLAWFQELHLPLHTFRSTFFKFGFEILVLPNILSQRLFPSLRTAFHVLCLHFLFDSPSHSFYFLVTVGRCLLKWMRNSLISRPSFPSHSALGTHPMASFPLSPCGHRNLKDRGPFLWERFH